MFGKYLFPDQDSASKQIEVDYTLAKLVVAQKRSRALASSGVALGQAIDFAQGLMDQTRADRANAW